jgi:uncharacterized protein YcfJ
MKKVLFSLLFISSVASATEYGIVKRVTPLHNMVTAPTQNCQQVTEHVPPSNNINIGTVVGAVGGNIIGKQIGSGGTNAIATFIGTGTGAILGHRMAQSDGYQTKTVCTTNYYNGSRVHGYNVVVDYKGRLISSYLNYNPIIGSQIPVNFKVGE